MTRDRRMAIFMAIMIVAWAAVAFYSRGATIFPSQYDSQIQSAVKQYWRSDFSDWLYGKSQLFAESRLDPNAVSATDAEGIAQFESGPWADVSRAIGLGIVSRKLSGPAILGYAYFQEQQRLQWKSPRPVLEREKLAEAAYNSGLGHIIAAQKLCDGALLWSAIELCLINVTGAENSKQTRDYVSHIVMYRAMIN
ncbi:MAG: lytic transglycosylase domain-containing protein [Patescibacteria group bacterium]|nr:lytic transglycosylase domain-containing protein [Patescibacteria group bacterium]